MKIFDFRFSIFDLRGGGSPNRKPRIANRKLFYLLLLPLCAAAGEPAEGGRKEPLPDEFEGVGLVEHLDAQLPLDLEFLDDAGAKITLGSYFNRNRPVLMVLVYFECPMLCTPLLNGMVDAMREIPLTPGKDYECVIVSFDPLEGPSLARKKKESLLESYARPGAGVGVHLLTGEKANIAKLAKAIGFGYKWNERDRMYAHPASLYVCTPAGRLSKYLKGVLFEPRTLRLSLTEAGQGRIGTASDQLALFCYQYDPAKGKYSLSAIRLMRICGVVTVLAIALGLVCLWGARRSRMARGSQVSSLKFQVSSSPSRATSLKLETVTLKPETRGGLSFQVSIFRFQVHPAEPQT